MGLFNWKGTVHQILVDLDQEARKADAERDLAVAKTLRIVIRILQQRLL
jgi:hypothetical protein